jgi:hypothetical protein
LAFLAMSKSVIASIFPVITPKISHPKLFKNDKCQ